MTDKRSGKTFLLSACLLLFALPVFSQQTEPEDRASRLMLAFSTAEYPATPGDGYNLSYHAGVTNGGAAVSLPLVLDAEYRLKVQNMGTINARNKTFLQVRWEVEALVARNYPMSGPVLTLVRMGSFTVPVAGETLNAGLRSVDGLTRVSGLLTDLAPGASSRLVSVTSPTGTTVTYDLFRAQRSGDLSQDPYVRPGDAVRILPAGRTASLDGAVFRPGVYELLPGEHLTELIEVYGNGFTGEADRDRIVILRRDPDPNGSRTVINLSWREQNGALLEDGDRVGVGDKESNRQAVFFEGALFSVPEDAELQEREERTRAVTRVPCYFYPGETAGQAARSIRAYFSDVSDLGAAYLVRGAEQTGIDLEAILYRNGTEGDIPLAGGDVIVIPFRRFYTITGEVTTAGSRALDSLTRLSGLLTDLAPGASSRLVSVTSRTGTTVTYDLFRAQRSGDLSQDPYILPGDTIRILPAGRTASLDGAVFRPGVYELLPGEELAALVEQYGGGFTLEADPGRIRLIRIDSTGAGETYVFGWQENAGMILKDRDAVSIGNKALRRPTVFFEGAVSQETGVAGVATTDMAGTAKLEYPFYEGETLGNAALANAGRFAMSADLANAYVERNGRRIAMDLRRFLYHHDFTRDLALENGDIIVIPFRQYFVLVTGAVKLPGRYPWAPDRQAEYYVSLAGGRDELQNNGRGITITDMNRQTVADGSLIEPETVVRVPVNRFTAWFNQYGPVITALLSMVSTVLTIFAVTGSL